MEMPVSTTSTAAPQVSGPEMADLRQSCFMCGGVELVEGNIGSRRNPKRKSVVNILGGKAASTPPPAPHPPRITMENGEEDKMTPSINHQHHITAQRIEKL